jgi:site-specific DNA-methyltransferase (cytosine-N4-specific)
MTERPAYITRLGKSYIGDSLQLIEQLDNDSIDLVMTSPPFALQRQKEYGNKQQDEYIDWLALFATALLPKLKDTGSFVLDLGGAYQKGLPVRSLYNYKVLIKFCEEIGYHLAEEFFWFNPAKLPSPIEWVNKRKIRVKDAVNTVWWFSKTPYPKADVRNVLAPYSDRMSKLIENAEKFYQPKERPSGHDISLGFAKDNGGAIPPNLLQIPNSESTSHYLKVCKDIGIKAHPARFPAKLPEFFIKMLTDVNDYVLDIFAGSNTTGFVAESLNRRWLAFDEVKEYVAGSVIRFSGTKDIALQYYERIMNGENIVIEGDGQLSLLE